MERLSSKLLFSLREHGRDRAEIAKNVWVGFHFRDFECRTNDIFVVRFQQKKVCSWGHIEFLKSEMFPVIYSYISFVGFVHRLLHFYLALCSCQPADVDIVKAQANAG